MRLLKLLALLPFAFSCQSGVTAPTPDAPVAANVDLSTWGTEQINLPPQFAPEFPEGQETLLFAPGWRDPDAEGFWSYVLLIEIEEAGLDAARLEQLFELYFDGLLGAVGTGKPFDMPNDPASVSVWQESGSHYRGVISMYNAFGEGEALKLNMAVEVQPQNASTMHLRVIASPLGHDDASMWPSLRFALNSLELE